MRTMPQDPVDVAVNLARSLSIMGIAVVVAVLVYVVAARTLFRLSKADRFAQEVSGRCRWPGRWTVGLLAVRASLPFTELGPTATDQLAHALTIGIIITSAWWALRLALAIEATLLSQLDLDVATSDFARRRQTQVMLLRRVAAALIIMFAIGAVLLTFDDARTLGTSLIASAGVIGLVVGIAAQTALGNLMAGIQIAVAEPIKMGDVVVVEGEWGTIEEITLTYVVIRIWDRRRLVLPTAYFISTPITNWSRGGTAVTGTVFWHLDHRTPVEAMRDEYLAQVEAHPLWDGKDASLLVTDTTEDRIEVRGMVTAADAFQLWDLRCALREGMLAWLNQHHPEALPTTRLLEAAPTPPRPQAPASSSSHVSRPPGSGAPQDDDHDRTQELRLEQSPLPGRGRRWR